MAANKDKTGAEERAQDITAGPDDSAELAVTQTGADVAEGAQSSAVTAEAEDEASQAPATEPALRFDPTDPFAVPADLMDILRTESSPRRRPAEESEDDAQGGERAEGAVVARRRRRRRRGDVDMELEGGQDGDPERTVTRVRAPRQSVPAASDTVQGVKGSTRLEAKRLRRRDSRSGGRRRTVITEAEFLARREAVDRKMLVRQRDQRIQIAVLEDGVLAEHFVSNTTQDSLIGNVYLGKVQNVLPSMEAAFVDIGRGRNAVLYAGEVNWDAAQLDGKPKKIENALKSGDTVLVQVTKDPVGHKGARLTSQVSLPGRYLVYVPGGSMTGISRKLPDVERARLKKILKDHLPQDAGVIVRTAAEGTSEQELQNDINRLRAQWEGIQAKVDGTKVLAPELLYAEPDLTIKTVRDVFNEDFSAMLVQGGATWDGIEAYVTYVAPHLLDRLHHWVPEDHDGEDLYATHRVDEQLHKALERKVYLPSGGSLVIDRTEAMTVVDVNTGKFTGSGGNLEETVTKNNLESAEEIVRQLRLRDIGGIIVIDFIDMVLESNRDLVLRRLVECLGRDRTKHQVAEVTSLGLVQMTRKRMGTGLVEVFSETCEHCAGRGILIQDAPVERGRAAEGSRGEGEGRRRRRRKDAGEGDQSGTPETLADGGVEEVDAEEERQRRERAEAARAALHSIAKASGKVSEHEVEVEVEAATPAEPAAADDAVAETPVESAETAVGTAGLAAEERGEDEDEAPRRRRRRGRRRGRGREEDAGDAVPSEQEAPAVAEDAQTEVGVAAEAEAQAPADQAAPVAAPAVAGTDSDVEADATPEAEAEDRDEDGGRARRPRRRRGGRGRTRRGADRDAVDGEGEGTDAPAVRAEAPESTDARWADPVAEVPASLHVDAPDTAEPMKAPAPVEPAVTSEAPAPVEPTVLAADGADAGVPRRRRSRRASSDGVVRQTAEPGRVERAPSRREEEAVETTEPSAEESTDATEVHEHPAAPAPAEEPVMVEPVAAEPTAAPQPESQPAQAAAPAGDRRRRSRRAVSADGVHVQVQDAAESAEGARFTAAVADQAAPARSSAAAPVMLGVGVKAADLARRSR